MKSPGRTMVLLILTMSPTAAQDKREMPVKCRAVEILSVTRVEDSENSPGDSDQRERIEVLPATAADQASGILRVRAYGPILGSMDARDVKISGSCTATGFEVTAAMTRSAEYTGSALKNVLWRPILEIRLAKLQRGVEGAATWKLFLTTGLEVHESTTGEGQARRFPITIVKKLGRLY